MPSCDGICCLYGYQLAIEYIFSRWNTTEDISPPLATIKKEGKSNDLSSMVGHHIEISNRFVA